MNVCILLYNPWSMAIYTYEQIGVLCTKIKIYFENTSIHKPRLKWYPSHVFHCLMFTLQFILAWFNYIHMIGMWQVAHKVQIGRWGGDGGTDSWSVNLPDESSRFTSIRIYSTRDCIYGIKFSYVDKDNHPHNSPVIGSTSGEGISDHTVRNFS